MILDWVPSHFPTDEHGLGFFDGTHLYEHADPRQGIHPDWNSFIFNYGRNEVRSFLLSSALFWLERYHADGLRVDAVASMLYLDYSRKEGEWIPNQYGGRENLEAIHVPATLQRRSLQALSRRPDHCRGIHGLAHGLPAHLRGRPGIRHEVGHGLDARHPGVYVQGPDLPQVSPQPADLPPPVRLLTRTSSCPSPTTRSFTAKGRSSARCPATTGRSSPTCGSFSATCMPSPAKKLLFMGGEFGQWSEWNHDQSLEWHLLQYEPHQGLQRWVRDLNRLYRTEPALYELDFDPAGFEWIDCNDSEGSTLSFMRKGKSPEDILLVVCNFTPVPRHNYRVGAPRGGFWKEDPQQRCQDYGGSGQGNLGGVEAAPISLHGRPLHADLDVAPLIRRFPETRGRGALSTGGDFGRNLSERGALPIPGVGAGSKRWKCTSFLSATRLFSPCAGRGGIPSSRSRRGRPGSLYFYPPGRRERAARPRFRFQPQGVHGPSQVIGPLFPWEDQGWFGTSPLGLCYL